MSWEQLLSISQEAREMRAEDRAGPPTACPRCGEPLESNSAGILHCRFDGWVWDGIGVGQ